MSGDGFLSRWSKRKQADKEAALDAETQTPHPLGLRRVGLSPEGRGEAGERGEAEGRGEEEPLEAEPPLPDVAELTAESDISGFLRQGVPEALRQAALRRVWALDPAIRDFVSPAEYAWDFNDPNSMAGFSGSAGSMDLTGFFSGEAGNGEVPPLSLATGEGAHVQHGGGDGPERRVQPSPPPPGSAVPLPRSAGEEPSRPDRAATAIVAGADPPDAVADTSATEASSTAESSDTPPRRHGSALPR